ncbi:MAG: hypothetical protein NT023_03370, partial [Armatimonadetes bacterium]|nr:hypothetical protein [Armatimonadota bacterium]
PLSFLAYKPGFPTASSRLRQVHQFLYSVLKSYLRRDGVDARSAYSFDRLVEGTFAKGIVLDLGVSKDGRYDGSTPLDMEVLLQLYYLDGFDPPKESNRGGKDPSPPSMPPVAEILAQDITSFLTVYSTRVPPSVLARYLMTLINFEMLIYTLRLMRATNALVSQKDTPKEFAHHPNNTSGLQPLDIYVDLTQSRGGRSDMLANACVNRDFEEAENFFRANLTLRTLHNFVEGNSDLTKQLKEKRGGEYITELWSLRTDPDIRSDARRCKRELEELFRGEDDNKENIPLDIRTILEHPDFDTLDQVIEMLVIVQRKNGMSSLMKWLSDVGGLDRSDGILRGNKRGRRRWSYAMSDHLLETLVQLAVISPIAQTLSGDTKIKPEPRSITLEAFLKYIHERFGLLIDTPPPFDNSSEATVAAKENLTALKQRLRQMGLFLDLSDDFNAQRIFPRFQHVETNESE